MYIPVSWPPRVSYVAEVYPHYVSPQHSSVSSPSVTSHMISCDELYDVITSLVYSLERLLSCFIGDVTLYPDASGPVGIKFYKVYQPSLKLSLLVKEVRAVIGLAMEPRLGTAGDYIVKKYNTDLVIYKHINLW